VTRPVCMFTSDEDHCCIIFFGCRNAFVDHEHLRKSFITTSHQLWFSSMGTLSYMYAATIPL
jgi:hypothetical protein